MNKELTYYFARLNIFTAYKNKLDFLTKAFISHAIFEAHSYLWGIIDVDTFVLDNENYISGNLVKYVIESTDEIVDKEQRKSSTFSVPNKMIAKSNFLLHIKTGIISYNLCPNTISMKQFEENMVELMRLSHNLAMVPADIQTITEEGSILEILKTWDHITKIKIKLHPSNPRFAERWKKIDTKMQKSKISSYNASYISETSLDLESDDYIKSEIYMAVDGYGNASAEGMANGKRKRINTKNSPIQTKVLADDKEKVYNILIETFRNIWNRMNK